MTLAHTQYLVEHRPPAPGRGRRRPPGRVHLAASLAEARLIAAELAGMDDQASAVMAGLGRAPEGELAGPFGLVRFAPAA